MPHQIGQPSHNDPGRREGWQERAVAGISAAQRRLISFHTSEDFRSMVKRAARARDMSISSYIRRCLAAFIALDLGMTFEEACYFNFRVTRSGTKSQRNPGRDDGEGFGAWRIKEIV